VAAGPPAAYLPGMSDPRADLMLDLLRAIRAEQAEIRTDLAEIKERLGILESQYASLSRRVDRLGGDMEQVKRRLGLIEA
jgi:predicted nuclease with TOPRIM domain